MRSCTLQTLVRKWETPDEADKMLCHGKGVEIFPPVISAKYFFADNAANRKCSSRSAMAAIRSLSPVEETQFVENSKNRITIDNEW